MLSTATVSLIDLFADDVLNSPYACFAALRDAGPAVGLGSDGLDPLRAYGDMVFNAIGPRNARVEASMAQAAKVVPWIAARCARDALSAGSIGAAIWDSVDSGEITADVAPLLVRSLLSAGLTTIAAIGNAIYAFATHPDASPALRANPSLLRTAFDGGPAAAPPWQRVFRT